MSAATSTPRTHPSTQEPGARELTARRGPIGELSISTTPTDRMRWWTGLSVGGLATAVVLALTGGFPIDVPMPTHAVGWVEPTCGLTRGSTAIARGDPSLAWRYNPASFLVMAFGIAGVARAAYGMATHRWLHVRTRLHRTGWLLLAVAIVAFWAYQQGNAEFIIHSRA